MENLKLPKFHWAKLLSIVFFILLLGAYANIFAIGIYNPGETLDPTCTPGSLDCTVNLITIETDPITGAINGLVKADGAGNISSVVSGTDIKTINGSSILGTGDILINSGWSLSGNSGTSSATNFIGTTDDVDLQFRRNNIFFGLIGTYNISLGREALSRVTSGAFNTAIGNLSLGYNTTGTGNTSVGNNSLSSNTTGLHNTAIGYSSLLYNTTGNYNTTVGGLGSNYSGSKNTALGQAALQYSGSVQTVNSLVSGVSYTIQYVGTTDFTLLGAPDNNIGTVFIATGPGIGSGRASGNINNNTALGYEAGSYSGLSSLNILSYNSLYLGYSTKASANGNNNEIVIGYEARGNGSNTATIGNTSLLRTYLTGVNLKAGTATAGTAPLKLTSGTNLSTTEAGAIEYDGSHLYFTATNGGSRYQLDQQGGGLLSDADFNTKGGTDAGLNLVAGAQNNTFLGYQAGRGGTVTSAADGNTGIGSQSLYSNTTGNGNTTTGFQSLYSNTTGHGNTANGLNSLFFNTTGYQNSSYGYASLYSNTTGVTNSTFGVYSLRFSITGNNNTALGYNSGTYINGGIISNTTSDYSIYLGTDTKAGADNNQNEIVIGYDTTGNGSNTATIGNNSLLRTYLTGVNLKAGTAVAGTAPLKLTSGTNLSSTEAGAIEYDGSHLYFTATDGGTRHQLDQQGVSSQWDNVIGGINYAGGNVGIGTTNPTSNLEIRLGVDTLYNQTFLGVGLDDATYSGTYTGTSTSDYIYVNIDGEGSPDSFSYFNDNGDCFGNGVSITGSAQLICNGISITFSSTTGHTNGDEWDYSISITPTLITDPVFTIGNGFNNYFVVNAVAPDSIFVGNNAGYQAISALESIFVGNNAGYEATNSATSNFIGSRAGYQAISANNSNFLGAAAGEGAVTANQSNFLGSGAGYQASSAHNSNFLGSGAGYLASSAHNSNFIGESSGYSASNAYNSNFMGYKAGYEAADALSSNFMGYQAGYQATNAAGSNFFGLFSGLNASDASESNFFGSGSGSGATHASFSNFLGFTAGSNANNASNSIFIGQSAGHNDTVNNTGNVNDFSILIGKNTNTGGFSNSIALGAYATNTATNQFMIGSATRPINETRINGSASTQCTITTGVGIACTSDERLKTNITDLPTDTLDKLTKVRTVNFNWSEGNNDTNNIGFLAQDLENYFPEVVSTDSEGYKSVYYSNMTPIIVQAIRELDLKVKNLDEKINGVTLSDMMGEFFGGVIVSISDGIAYMKGVVVDTLKVGSPEKRTGITLYDELTGDPYCLSISGGVTKTIEGECGIITPVEPMEEETVEVETVEAETVGEEAGTNTEPSAEETLPEDSVPAEEIPVIENTPEAEVDVSEVEITEEVVSETPIETAPEITFDIEIIEVDN